MAIVTTDAVVLKQKNFQEADKIITVYSREFGKFDAVVKGIRKSRRRAVANIEPGSYINMAFYQKSNRLSYIKETSIKNAFLFLRNDIHSLVKLLYILDLTDNMIKEINLPNESIFNLIVNTILLIRTANLDTLLRFFELRIMKLSGYELSFEGCSSCGTAIVGKMSYDFVSNELLCRKCSKGKKNLFLLSEEDIDILNGLNKFSVNEIEKFGSIPEVSNEKLKNFMSRYISGILGYEIKSQGIINELSV